MVVYVWYKTCSSGQTFERASTKNNEEDPNEEYKLFQIFQCTNHFDKKALNVKEINFTERTFVRGLEIELSAFDHIWLNTPVLIIEY